MHNVLLLGAGKIGRMIAKLLQDSGDYDVLVGDSDQQALERIRSLTGATVTVLNAASESEISKALAGRDSVISALSFRFNPLIASVATKGGASYFDLTEDVETTRKVREAEQFIHPTRLLMPQCGLAPGFISIVAHHIAQQFDSLERVHMRVGALPQFPTNALKYNLTWSTDGLINEYCNPCEAIHNAQRMEVLPLEGMEHFSLDGVRYEAFNTSGGLGSLCETLDGKVRELNYKTIRYQGHRDLMSFLVNELRLGDQRDLLKDILERALPVTFQDVVVIFVTVTGRRGGQFVQLADARKIYSQTIGGEKWSAIQITTAAAACTLLDLHAQRLLPVGRFVRQEEIPLDQFLENRFGGYYQTDAATRFSRPNEDQQDTLWDTPD